jgi:hypothetical protein
MPRVRRALGAAALLLASTVVSLAAAEVAFRLLDRYPLTSLGVPSAPGLSWLPRPPRTLAPVVAPLTTAADTDPAWIDVPPPPLKRPPVDPDLLALRHAAAGRSLNDYDLDNVWNREFVKATACTPGSILRQIPMPLLVFDPSERSVHPPYRYRPECTTPLGLTTNRFGWRGPDIPLDKPPGRVRLAFAGASTTVGQYSLPFSYPEYVVHWLNLWAAHAGLAVRFDGINAGRTGIGSTDIAAIVRQEVLPAEPDLVVYYEGANQFVCDEQRTAAERSATPWKKGRPSDTWERLVRPLYASSALVQHLERLVIFVAARGGYEPAKPPSRLAWPGGVDETAPDIARPDLPLHLPTILGDLEAMRLALEGSGAELAVSSFVWLAADGLWLDPNRDGLVYRWLNDRCWPHRYADIRRLADFQNRVLARYAAARGIPFLDVAAAFPTEPALFLDAIHFNGDGTRVHAWIVLQALIPYIRGRLESGAWPREDRMPLVSHPGIGEPEAYTLPACGSGMR